jgi:hypothetical protein
MPQVQHLRVALDNRNAFRGTWFCRVLQFGLEDAIPSAPSLAFPPLGPGLGEKFGAPHAARCSFCPLPQTRRVTSKCSEGCGTSQVPHLRVALDNRYAFRGKCFGLVFWVRLGGRDPAQQLLRSPSPRSARGSAKNVRDTGRTLQLLPAAAVLTGTFGVFQRFSVMPWTIEMLFAGNGLARCCSSAWRMRSRPAASSLAFPPARPGARRKMCFTPRRTLQLLPAAAVFKCEVEVFRRLRDAT